MIPLSSGKVAFCSCVWFHLGFALWKIQHGSLLMGWTSRACFTLSFCGYSVTFKRGPGDKFIISIEYWTGTISGSKPPAQSRKVGGGVRWEGRYSLRKIKALQIRRGMAKAAGLWETHVLEGKGSRMHDLVHTGSKAQEILEGRNGNSIYQRMAAPPRGNDSLRQGKDKREAGSMQEVRRNGETSSWCEKQTWGSDPKGSWILSLEFHTRAHIHDLLGSCAISWLLQAVVATWFLV